MLHVLTCAAALEMSLMLCVLGILARHRRALLLQLWPHHTACYVCAAEAPLTWVRLLDRCRGRRCR